jgi:1,4-alpha-glucan branching enzyme
MSRGYLSLVLHTHLPYVRHPECDGLFEERWLFEAITECYIPLVKVFDGLVRDGVRFRVTVSISPTLITMLQDALLQERYLRHLEKLIELGEKEVARTRYDSHLNYLAGLYLEMFREARSIFEDVYGRDLIRAFRRFQDEGVVEVITCGATHGFLPLMRNHPGSVRAQILVAQQTYTRAFGRPSSGIWLPECGYFPGVEHFVREAGFRYFIIDSHGVENASVRPHYGLNAPIACPNGIAAFPRDPESSKQVWSSKEGFPGDVDYREYYRDIGYDLDFDYIKPYILDEKIRINTGFKYHRITGPGDWKDYYHPDWAREKAARHAGVFMHWREKQIEHFGGLLGRPPIIVAPYDAELFGHWWFEGPQWIDLLIRKIVFDQHTIELASPGDYLDRLPVVQRAVPSASSWGHEGHNEFWLNGQNDWILPHLHRAAGTMSELARWADGRSCEPLERRALQQAARSLLLAQASDWPFIMKTGTAVDYAHRRIRDHLARFHYLERGLYEGCIDSSRLEALEELDRIFPEIDPRVFLS